MLLLVAIALAGAAAYDAAIQTLAQSDPTLVLRFQPGNAQAIDIAFQLAASKTPTGLPYARWARQARIGLQGNPLSPGLVQIVSADPHYTKARSEALLTAGEALSRRTLLTQLALIQAAVDAGRVDLALAHYDRALLVYPDLRDTLFPILTGALAEPQVRDGVAALARHNRAWIEAFVAFAAQRPDAAGSLALLLGGVDHGPGAWPLAAHYEGELASRRAAAGDYAGARHLAMRALGRDAGSIDRTDFAPAAWNPSARPLTWTPVASGDLTAEPGEGGGVITAAAGSSGLALTRTLVIAPGRYRLAATVATAGGVEPARGRLALVCLGAGQGDKLADLPLDPVTQRSAVLASMPERCAAVRLDVTVDNAAAGTDTGFVLRRISLRPAS